MKLLYEKDNKQQLFIFLKFYFSYYIRFQVACALFCCFTEIINIIFEKLNVSSTTHFCILFIVSRVCVFFIKIHVLKLSSLLKYETFKVIWTTSVPKSIFSKSFFYPVIALGLLGKITNILLTHYNLYPLFTGLLVSVFLLHIFILNNWLPFQLIPLNPQDVLEKPE